MSDTESFEHAMAEMRKAIADDCGMYDGDYCKCQCDILDRLQRAHERELEHLRKAEYARGYHDGQRSMDAEHYAVALRLMHLPLDCGSHENLSQIARAVYHADFGWTQGACEALRDELVRLMGGVHEPSSFAKSSDFGKLGDDVHGKIDKDCQIHQTTTPYDVLGNERHKAVCELKKIHADAGGFVKALANALGVEWQAPRVVQTIAEVRDRLIHLLGGDEVTVVYNELGNERHKAVCALMNERDNMSDNMADNVSRIMYAIDARPKVGERVCKAIADRLIHLLGGDEPTLSEVAAELRQASVDAMSKRADQSHESSTMRLENETGIADELRKKIHEKVNQELYVVVEADDLYAIADNIDEQFNRICMQQEAVLQSTIDTMVDERDHLRRQMDQQRAMLTEQRDEARAKVLRLESENAEWRRGAERDADKLESLTGAYNDAVSENDELRKKLEELEKFDRDTSLAAFGDDNEELRKLLSRAAKLLVNAEQDRDANYAYWMSCKEAVVQKSVTIDELSKELEDARDALNDATGRWARADEERHELQDRLDAIREAVNAVQ